MKTFSRLWKYLADFFLEWEMFQVTVVETIRMLTLCSITFFWKSCGLWNKVKLHARKHTQMPVHPHPYARTPMHTLTHTEKHRNNGFADAPWCYVIRTLPVLVVSHESAKCLDNAPDLNFLLFIWNAINFWRRLQHPEGSRFEFGFFL
jgi:hypothetical protein